MPRRVMHGGPASVSAAALAAARSALPVPQAFKLHRTLSYRLHVLHKLSDRDSAAAYLADAGLPLGEGRCLAAIGAFAPLSVNDLAQRANLDKGQASRAAQSLVDQRLIVKEASATDGRAVVLKLTRTGVQTWRRVAALIERRNDEVFGCLSAAERKQLGALFDRLIEHATGAKQSADGRPHPTP